MNTSLTTLAVILCLMVGLWLVSLVRKDASIVDPFWGAGFVLVAAIAWQLNKPDQFRPQLLIALTAIWGLRLSLFLLWRNWGHGEDRRYTKMREHHGRRFWWVSLFSVFVLQGLILWFVALPVQMAIAGNSAKAVGWIDVVGIAVWGIGVVFESVGDWQLAKFKAEPANSTRVMDRGLWRYTRHPNYFGDFCVWWGLYLIAAAGGAWWTIASPVLMSFLLLKVSGVTLLESTIVDRRPEYAAYRARTNAFFPGPPSSDSR
ncbi:MAG: DUF1295 domain-containing protein [Planctomycetaceae bacterium]